MIAIEKKFQAQWKENGVFQVDAPSNAEVPFNSISPAALRKKHPKFFGTMAYPYMNGTLHAGHSFTASKVEFTTGFAARSFPVGVPLHWYANQGLRR